MSVVTGELQGVAKPKPGIPEQERMALAVRVLGERIAGKATQLNCLVKTKTSLAQELLSGRLRPVSGVEVRA